MLVELTWRSDRALAVDYLVLLRAGDDTICQIEQPGHGLLPTTAWPAGEKIVDRRWLRVPESLAGRDEWSFGVELIDPLTGESLGAASVDEVRLR